MESCTIYHPVSSHYPERQLLVDNVSELPRYAQIKANDQGLVSLRILSTSPNGRYLLVESPSETYLCLKRLPKCGGRSRWHLMSFSRGLSDSPSCFLSQCQWYEEYGFLKLCFFDSESLWDGGNRRLYFDRELYRRERARLHGG